MAMIRIPCLLVVLWLLVMPGWSAAGDSIGGVRLSGLFTDRMVLPRDREVPVWGKAQPGTKIEAVLRGNKSTSPTQSSLATADNDGKWCVRFQPLAAGGPMEMEVRSFYGTTTGTSVLLQDILVGDVWLCSGQSNMAMALNRTEDGESEAAQSSNTQIRLFQVPLAVRPSPAEDVAGNPSWKICGPESAGEFSAVAYYFGRDLQQHLGVPIGLVQSAVGGTTAEAWMSRSALQEFPEFIAALEDIASEAKDPSITRRWYERQLARYHEQVRSSRETTGTSRSGRVRPRLPNRDGHPRRTTVLYNGMIHPLRCFPFRGVLWYQGESNVSRADQYRKLLPALIRDWRAQLNSQNLPFLIVQLPRFRERKPHPIDDTWAELREAQLLTHRRVPATGLAVTIDTGDPKDIHPVQKEPVGSRLALAARAIAHREELTSSGPLYTTATLEGDSYRVYFDHAGGGLATSDESPQVRGFAVAGADRKFSWASAVIDANSSNTVLVKSPVENPMAVRYGWQANPDVNLVNSDGLPASPFRTDRWPGISNGNTKDSAPPPK